MSVSSVSSGWSTTIGSTGDCVCVSGAVIAGVADGVPCGGVICVALGVTYCASWVFAGAVVGAIPVGSLGGGAVGVAGCAGELVVEIVAGDSGVGVKLAAVGVAGCACGAAIVLGAEGICGCASSGAVFVLAIDSADGVASFFSTVAVPMDVAHAIGFNFSASIPSA